MGKFTEENSDATCHYTPMEAADEEVQYENRGERTTAWEEAIAKIVKLLKKKAKELTAKTDKEKYENELTTIGAVQALSDAGARAALSALIVRGRGDTELRKEGRHALLIEHLGLTEEMN